MPIGQRHIRITVNDWKFSHDLFPEEQNETGRRLTLIGETHQTHFLHPQIAEIELFESNRISPQKIHIEPDSAEHFLGYGDLVKFDEDEEYDIPDFINGAIAITPDNFESIFSVKKKKNNHTIELVLGVYGLDLCICSIEGDKWPDKKHLSITEVKLHHYKEKNV